MKAIVYTKYGSPDVLELKEIDKPVPRDSEVLIKVHAVSLNDWDLGLLDGDFVNRLLNGFSKPKIKILGSDIAGEIVDVGASVKKFKIGDAVYGDLSGTWGGLAEYVCASEDKLAMKPGRMSFEDAAAIPQAGMLAVQGLLDKGQLQRGQKILVNGAGGGVGTFAIQIAKSYDVEMTGVDTAAKLEMMKSLGYHHVIDYRKEDFTRTGEQYDLILDVKTKRSVVDYARALRRGGKYVTVGGDMNRILQMLFIGPLISLTTKKKMTLVVLKTNKDLGFMNDLFEKGKLKPIIDGPYRLEETARAFRMFSEGKHKGKVVIRVVDN
jgi:NADPH:quinone reductase-like Zn-dependent oxidoreductase